MLWFLALHIIALLFWAATILYLPVTIAGSKTRQLEFRDSTHHYDSVARFIFTCIAGPAALLAIVMGTAVFLIDGNSAPWLIAKLSLVTLLVIGQALTGILIMRLEKGRSVQPWCGIFLVFFVTIMAAIVWLVLAKPAWEFG